jgi:hypothetical protein
MTVLVADLKADRYRLLISSCPGIVLIENVPSTWLRTHTSGPKELKFLPAVKMRSNARSVAFKANAHEGPQSPMISSALVCVRRMS